MMSFGEFGMQMLIQNGVTFPPDMDGHKLLERSLRLWRASVNKTDEIPPLVEDVGAYLNEINYPIDPQEFIDFYQAKGWRVGHGTQIMKDWRSSARNWKRNGWGHQLVGSKPAAALRQSVSLGSLQLQQDRVLQEVRDIRNPGGRAYAKTADELTDAEKARLDALKVQYDRLKHQIENFGA